MPTSTFDLPARLPGRLEDLIAIMPPCAITDETALHRSIEMIDALMTRPRLTKGQALYMETLVQLVEAYESAHDPIDTDDLSGLDTLAHLLANHDMNASDLARLLGVHVSMGSKIMHGDRSLTVDHLRTLAKRFSVSPAVFID